MVCEDLQNCDEHIAFVNRVWSVRELVLALLSLSVSERKFSFSQIWVSLLDLHLGCINSFGDNNL